MLYVPGYGESQYIVILARQTFLSVDAKQDRLALAFDDSPDGNLESVPPSSIDLPPGDIYRRRYPPLTHSLGLFPRPPNIAQGKWGGYIGGHVVYPHRGVVGRLDSEDGGERVLGRVE